MRANEKAIASKRKQQKTSVTAGLVESAQEQAVKDAEAVRAAREFLEGSKFDGDRFPLQLALYWKLQAGLNVNPGIESHLWFAWANKALGSIGYHVPRSLRQEVARQMCEAALEDLQKEEVVEAFTQVVLASKSEKVQAGPGAGVTLEMSGEIPYKVQRDSNDKATSVTFDKALVDVTFHSAYDTQKAYEGLSIQLDPITDEELLHYFEKRFTFDRGTLDIVQDKTTVVDPNSEYNSQLVLSPGWSRTSYNVGDTFTFKLEVDADYAIYLPATATFTEDGELAWNDLDNPPDEDVESSTVTAASDLHKRAALLILADAVASFAENEYQKNDTEETEQMFREFVRPQEELMDTVPASAQEHGLDIDKYLPLAEVQKMDDSMKKNWGLTFEELADAVNDDCVLSAVMQMLGHGVSAWDDYTEELNALGISKDKRLGYFDHGIADDEAYELYQDILNAKTGADAEAKVAKAAPMNPADYDGTMSEAEMAEDIIAHFDLDEADEGDKEIADKIRETLKMEEGPWGSWSKDAGTFEKDGEEWVVFRSEDSAEQVAKDNVKQQLEDEPELFTQSWLQNFATITPTDRRIIAGEEAEARLEGYSDSEIMEEAGKLGHSDGEEPEDGWDEDAIERAKDFLRGEWQEEIEKQLEDPIQYFVHDQGIYTVEELFKANFISIDIEAATEDAIRTDGWAHFLSTYNGNYEETSKGLVIFRYN